jgi:NADPH:quinone reductase-like Zn-dependent oxidoreductase
MRRIVVRRPGGYDRLHMEDGPDPQPGPGQVRVDVEAAGVNYADCLTRMGLYASARQLAGYPLTPGFEVAGTVGALGKGADGPSVGSPVLAVTLFGGYATQVVVPASQVFPMPASLSVAQAASSPVAFLTAWYAVHEAGRPSPGQTVMVHSAAGGVGGALVQLCRIAGCHVVAVVGGSHKAPVPYELGAHQVIDTSREDLWARASVLAPRGFDVVFDANGVSTLRASYNHLRPTGRLVVYGFHSMLTRGRGRPGWTRLILSWLRTPRFDPMDMTLKNRSVLGFNLSFLSDRADLLERGMAELLSWIGEGRLVPLEVTPYSFEDVARAHRDLETGRTVGKLALVV